MDREIFYLTQSQPFQIRRSQTYRAYAEHALPTEIIGLPKAHRLWLQGHWYTKLCLLRWNHRARYQGASNTVSSKDEKVSLQQN